jgi:hypothetical protein
LRDRVVLGTLALGLLVRVLIQFPTYKYPGDADALLSPATTLDVIAGNYPVFYSGVRLGALEAYLQVPLVLIFGATRGAVALTPILIGLLTMTLYAVFVGSCLDRPLARTALLFLALPAPNVMAWTSLPNSYPTTVLLGLSTLVLAQAFSATGRPPLAAALGLAAGLGFWNSMQTLSCTLAAGLWVLLLKRDGLRLRTTLVATVAFTAGASPWIAYNVAHPLASFREGYGAQMAAGLSAALDNVVYLLGTQSVDLLTASDWLPLQRHSLPTALRGGVLALYAAVLIVLLVYSVRRLARREAANRGGRPPAGWLLMAAAAAIAVILFIVSRAGQARGFAARYLLLAYFVIPVGVALTVDVAGRIWRPLAYALIFTLALFNLSSYPFPWTAERAAWREAARDDEALLTFLEGREVTIIVGDYWSVYSFNYLPGGRIRAVPLEWGTDVHFHENRLPDSGGKVAVVTRFRERLVTWVTRAGLRGTEENVGGYAVFFPERTVDSPASPVEFVARLRAVL